MSRRRFGDADDTYKDFISAIDDHKRKRAAQQQAALLLAQQAAAVQQAAQQPTASPSAAVPPAAVGGYQSGPYDPLDLGSMGRRASEVEEDYATALPVNAMDREVWMPRRASSIAIGSALAGGGIGGIGGGGSLNGDPSASPYDDETPLIIKGSGEGGGGGGGVGVGVGDHAWISKRKLDLVIQRKSILIFANALFGIVLMVAILQVCWDPVWQTKRYGVDMSAGVGYYNDLDFVSARLHMKAAPLPTAWTLTAIEAQCPSPLRSYVTESLKLVLLLSTLVLCWQILDRKRMQVNIKFREQRRKLKAKGYNQERDKLYIGSVTAASQVSTLGLLTLSTSAFRWELWLSLLVCLVQPIPFTHQLTGGAVSDKIGLLMWLRLHLLFRVIRDCSEIWLARRSIRHQQAFQTKTPDFDWWLACKTIHYRDPLFFAGCFYLTCIVLFGHSLYIAERDLLPRFFDFWTSLFVSLQIVSDGWPADVWEIYMPITMLGKMVSLLAGMAGLLLIAFVISTVGMALSPTKFEENALNFIAMEKVRQKEREGSARLIQYVWKNAAREAELRAKLAPKNPPLYEEIAEQEEKAFMENFIARSKELRTVRRERAELEERYDPTSEKNISPIDQYFDTKLEAIRTDIQHQHAKNQQQFMHVLASLNQLMHKAQKEKQKAAAAAAAAAGTGAAGGSAGAVGSGKKQRAASRAARHSNAEALSGGAGASVGGGGLDAGASGASGASGLGPAATSSTEPPLSVPAAIPSASPTGSSLSPPHVLLSPAEQRHEEANSYRRELQDSIAEYEHEHGVAAAVAAHGQPDQDQEQLSSAEPRNVVVEEHDEHSDEGHAPGER